MHNGFLPSRRAWNRVMTVLVWAAALLVMALVKKTGKLSIAGVSICGGIFHNVGQILVAMVVVENMSIAYYMPVLLISGVITGCLIGIAAGEVKRRLPGMNAGRQED